MSNWKTSAAGYGAAIMNAWATGGLDGNWKALVASALIAAIGHWAKDAQ